MTGDPCELVVVDGPGGARLEGCRHGGHITRWWPAGATQPRLWLSPRYDCGPGVAIRGGIPVIFPQFSALGQLPKHGLVRDRAWEVRDPRQPGELAFGLRLTETSAWPHRASLTLRAHAENARLDVDLHVINEGSEAFGFTGALHAYLAVSSTAAATLHGLDGADVTDATTDSAATSVVSGPLGAQGPQDLMVRGADLRVTVRDPQVGSTVLTAAGFDSWVVWNPGRGHTLADVAPGDEMAFVCVEPAQLDERVLPPGQSWRGSLTLKAGS
jgi:glucose-6-phosphate 1-epimerase